MPEVILLKRGWGLEYGVYSTACSASVTGLVVVVVYLTTNQRHVGYLSSGDGHMAGRYSTP